MGSSHSTPPDVDFAARGMITSRPTLVHEDGSGFPEFVIPTNPAHRSNALDLRAKLDDRLGVSRRSASGPREVHHHYTIHVHGAAPAPGDIANAVAWMQKTAAR